jgi:DNA modification methylase
MPRYFVEGLSKPGDVILDPMAGSGTTSTEAWLAGRKAISIDLDLLATRICAAKTTIHAPSIISELGAEILSSARKRSFDSSHLQSVRSSWDNETSKFVDYWFLPETQSELAALATSIDECTQGQLHILFEVIFSSLIVTKSGGVSMAMDLAHTRPHRVATKIPKSPLKVFEMQLARTIRAYDEIAGVEVGDGIVLNADSRKLPIESNSIDLIVTSPPYANALDYMRAHKFALVWFGEKVRNLGTMRSQYIGAEKWEPIQGAKLPHEVMTTISWVYEKDRQKGRVLEKYFGDMTLALKEMHRVLERGRPAIIVVGPSTMRGITIPTHHHLASIADMIGFRVAGMAQRQLDRNRRMLPTSAMKNGHSQIEQRMHEEFIIGLIK